MPVAEMLKKQPLIFLSMLESKALPIPRGTLSLLPLLIYHPEVPRKVGPTGRLTYVQWLSLFKIFELGVSICRTAQQLRLKLPGRPPRRSGPSAGGC
jgi:hypothetical protein